MCESHTCTDCILEWCPKPCQAWQGKFPGCRCSDWPEDRKSFSGGDFAGKGGFSMPATSVSVERRREDHEK